MQQGSIARNVSSSYLNVKKKIVDYHLHSETATSICYSEESILQMYDLYSIESTDVLAEGLRMHFSKYFLCSIHLVIGMTIIL